MTTTKIYEMTSLDLVTGKITKYTETTTVNVTSPVIVHPNEPMPAGRYKDDKCQCGLWIAVAVEDYKTGANYCRNCLVERLSVTAGV